MEYATNILNRSLSRTNTKRASPFEVLTKKIPDLRSIVTCGSVYDVYRGPRKNSQRQIAQVVIIVGKSGKMKVDRVFLKTGWCL